MTPPQAMLRLLALCLGMVFLAACGGREASVVKPASTAAMALRHSRGELDDPRIREASGLAASRLHRGVLWLHNDSGDTTRVFAINTQARLLGTYYLSDARARDWEDIAIGPGPDPDLDYLYVGDIGDNQMRRKYIVVYRVPEPDVRPHQEAVEASLDGVETLAFAFPDGPHNSETLMVDPATGDIYIVTKALGRQSVYRAAYPQRRDTLTVLEKVTELRLQGSGALTQLAVGGDISPSGRWTLIKSYDVVYQWDNGTAPWYRSDPIALPYVPEPQGEAIAWAADESGYFTISEEAGGVPAVLYYYALSPREGTFRSTRLRD
ncbi:MAG: hypothetical protein R2834_13375 [Rhodothermales bacterium]